MPYDTIILLLVLALLLDIDSIYIYSITYTTTYYIYIINIYKTIYTWYIAILLHYIYIINIYKYYLYVVYSYAVYYYYYYYTTTTTTYYYYYYSQRVQVPLWSVLSIWAPEVYKLYYLDPLGLLLLLYYTILLPLVLPLLRYCTTTYTHDQY